MTMTACMTGATPDRSRLRRGYALGVAALGLLFVGRASWDIGEAARYAADGVTTEARLVGITHVPEGPGRMSHYARIRYVGGGRPIIVASENRINDRGRRVPFLPMSTANGGSDMARAKITVEQANHLAVQFGFFDGLHKMIQDYDVSREYGASMKAMMFKYIMIKVTEAKKEIVTLQAALTRLEAACKAGMIEVPAEGHQAYSASVNRLRQEMKAFDGWTISLLESDISLLATVQNPETAGIRVNNLKDSFAKLFAVRWQGPKPYANHPDLFNLGIYDRTRGISPP